MNATSPVVLLAIALQYGVALALGVAVYHDTRKRSLRRLRGRF